MAFVVVRLSCTSSMVCDYMNLKVIALIFCWNRFKPYSKIFWSFGKTQIFSFYFFTPTLVFPKRNEFLTKFDGKKSFCQTRQFYLLKGIHCNTGNDLSMHIFFVNLTIFSYIKEQCIFFFKWELCLLPEACCTLIKSYNIWTIFSIIWFLFQEIPFQHIWSGNQNNLHCSFSLELVEGSSPNVSCKIQVYQKAILSNRQVLNIQNNFNKEVIHQHGEPIL